MGLVVSAAFGAGGGDDTGEMVGALGSGAGSLREGLGASTCGAMTEAEAGTVEGAGRVATGSRVTSTEGMLPPEAPGAGGPVGGVTAGSTEVVTGGPESVGTTGGVGLPAEAAPGSVTGGVGSVAEGGCPTGSEGVVAGDPGSLTGVVGSAVDGG
jgi:hypothetical protein